MGAISYNLLGTYGDAIVFSTSMQKISDYENKTDVGIAEYLGMADYINLYNMDTSSLTWDQFIHAYEIKKNSTTEEIEMLKDLNSSLTNDVYKGYVNLEIERLNNEAIYYQDTLDIIKYRVQWENGEIDSIEYLTTAQNTISNFTIHYSQLNSSFANVNSYLAQYPSVNASLGQNIYFTFNSNPFDVYSQISNSLTGNNSKNITDNETSLNVTS